MKELVVLECRVRGTLFGECVGWVHRIKADLTYVDLDVPPDDAVTVTGARGGRAALRKWRPVCNPEAAVEKSPFLCGGVETFFLSFYLRY